MKAVIQRVSEASVTIEGKITGQIANGYLILLGVEVDDTPEDVSWLCAKIIKLRIFSDEMGKMNLSLADVNGSILLISQFTLHALTHRGSRPSYIKAARPEQAIPLYEKMITDLNKQLRVPIETGIFGADMKVSLVNDGPVTIIIDSKKEEVIN